MEIRIEEQSLATLKEWSKKLGLRNVSTLRKPALIEYMKERVGEERIARLLQMEGAAQASAPAGEDAAAQAPAEPAAPRAAAPGPAAPAPAETPAPAAPTGSELTRRTMAKATSVVMHQGDERRRIMAGRYMNPRYSQNTNPDGQAPSQSGYAPRTGYAGTGYRQSAPSVFADRSGTRSPEDSGGGRSFGYRQQPAAYDNNAPESAPAPEPRQKTTYRGGFGTYAPTYPGETRTNNYPGDAAEEGREEERPAPKGYFLKPAPTANRAQENFPPVRPYDALQEETAGRPAPGAATLPNASAGPNAPAGQSTALPNANPFPEVLPDFPETETPPEDDGVLVSGILEVMQEGNYGFIRARSGKNSSEDYFIAMSQIKRFRLKTGDHVSGIVSSASLGSTDRSAPVRFIKEVNGLPAELASTRTAFENLTPVFPHERIHLETDKKELSMRLMDLMAPIGKGQRGMIVSPPKAGKTTLIKQVASAIVRNHPEMTVIILLIDERPEEVTDIRESIKGPNVEIMDSTFDETPEHHKKIAELVYERGQRLVESGKDAIILLDSITRLARAYNLTVTPSGRTLSGGLDPAALYDPKKFFGAARKMREGGSLTILATALVDTGSRLDDMVYEEFKGTGNMEMQLDRKLSERRIFPAIDILKSGTRRDDLLLSAEEMEAAAVIRRAISQSPRPDETLSAVLDMLETNSTNADFCRAVLKKGGTVR